MTYHATYRSSTSARDAFEIWRSRERFRVDQRFSAQRGEIESSVLVDRDEAILCERENGAWSCRSTTPPAVDPLLGDAVDGLETKKVAEAKSRTIEGLRVRCFDVASGSTRSTICLTSDGIVARIVSGTSFVRELTDLETGDDAVDEDVFDPPARVER